MPFIAYSRYAVCYLQCVKIPTNYFTKGNVFTVNQDISQKLTPITILKNHYHDNNIIYYCDLSHIFDYPTMLIHLFQ